jgi:hypothetical protein
MIAELHPASLSDARELERVVHSLFGVASADKSLIKLTADLFLLGRCAQAGRTVPNRKALVSQLCSCAV